MYYKYLGVYIDNKPDTYMDVIYLIILAVKGPEIIL